MKFLLVDTNHLFFRSRYSVRGNDNEKVGMCLHLMLSSLAKVWRIHKADHLVFCFDGKSWRKSVYTPYKANRTTKRLLQTSQEKAEADLFFEAFEVFRKFISERTNCTVLIHPELEADDLIAGFIQAHSTDEHIIVSSDGDFEQLLADNVSLYNGVDDTTTTTTGVYDYKGNPVKVKKTGLPKTAPDPEWSLFEKCVRGCTTDNIFSAYPGIREKSTKKRVGLREAFDDRKKQGFNWSAVMMHRWVDHHNVEHRVLDDYNRNRELVDLTRQPAKYRAMIDETVANFSVPRKQGQIGMYFLKLCGKYDLSRASDNAKQFSELFSAPYPTK